MSESASAVSDSAGGSDILASLSDDQRSEWFKTGNLPESETPAAPVVDEDAVEDAAEVVESKPAAPVPTPPAPVSKRQQQINDLIRARAEADQRVAALEAKLAAQSAPKPAEKPVQAPKVEAKDKPTVANFDTYEEYVEALTDWKADQRDAQRAEQAAQERRAQQEQQATQQAQEKLKTWATRAAAFAATSPAFDTVAVPFLNQVAPGTPLYDVLTDSPVGPQLALHLAEHPDEWARIGALSVPAALREIGKIEAKYESKADTSASAGPAAKHVTTAPAPPVTLGTRLADPADTLEAAIATQDFRAYEAAANRRDLARK